MKIEPFHIDPRINDLKKELAYELRDEWWNTNVDHSLWPIIGTGLTVIILAVIVAITVMRKHNQNQPPEGTWAKEWIKPN